MLIAARFAQAIGGSGSVVLARAVVRDLYSGSRAGRELSLMGMIMAIAPAVGPFVGGIFHAAFGWEANFLVALLAGLVCLFIVWRRLPETLTLRADPLSFSGTLRSYRSIWKSAAFRAHLGIISCVYSGLFAWISGSPFAFQYFYHLSPFGYGTMYAVSSIGFMIGTAYATRYVVRYGLDRIIGAGTVATAIGGLAMMAAVGFDVLPVEMLTLAAAIFLAGLGLSLPQAMAGALTPYPDRAGAASSLIGFVQQSCAALVGGIVGLMIDASAWPLAVSVALMGCLAFVIWGATRDARRSAQHPV
jgi:DHA1 family bicyclomycin/chloramphenicol resistance-like MFS transporter